MRFSIALAATLAGCAAITCAWAFPSEPTGFRGIDWGTPPTDVPELVLHNAKDKDGVSVFTRPSDALSIGDVPMKYISYEFFNDRFFGVFMVSENNQTTGIMRTLREQFGPGVKAFAPDTYDWRGALSTIHLSCNATTGSCFLMINSTALDAARQRAKGGF